MTADVIEMKRSPQGGPPGPASIEAEQALLGAVLLNPDAYAHAAVLVKTEQFSEELHRRIFDVMGQLLQAGRPITLVGLIAHLGDQELGGGVTTRRYLATLCAEASSVLLAPEHARIIRDAAVRRTLIEVGGGLIQRATDAAVDCPPDEVAATSMDAIRVVLEGAPRAGTRFGLGAGAAEYIGRIEALRRGEGEPPALMTGFEDLDRKIGGLHPGTIVFVAGRPAMGKTIVMTSIATNVARRNKGVGVLEFSLEIPGDELLARHLASATFHHERPIPFSAIMEGRDLSDEEVQRIVLAQRDLEQLPIVAECPPRITVAEIVGRIQVERRAMAARGLRLGVVLIDYLDKITAPDRYAGQRTYEIQEIITALKSAARSEEVCIVLLAQLNRGTEQRRDQRPMLADLKSSGFIEQEAHAIIFVYREAYYLLTSEEYRDDDPETQQRFLDVEHDVELLIGKNRSGPTTMVKLWGHVGCSYLSSHGH